MYSKCVLLLFLVGFAEALSRYSGDSCGYPRLANGKVKRKPRSKIIKYICLRSYELVGNTYATCMGSDWDVPTPVCVRSGCDVPEIENGVSIPTRDNAWVVFFCLPGHKMTGSSTIYCDGYRWNATAPTCNVMAPITLPKCDFEDPDLCGWVQDYLHDFDWKRISKNTPSYYLKTGPTYDHTYGKRGAGYYMYIESNSVLQNDTARLISPVFDKSLLKDGCFIFFYHMFGRTTGGLRVYQKPEYYDLETLMDLSPIDKKRYILFEKWGDHGDTWFEAVLPLNDHFPRNFQIIIEGIRGPGITSDIAIDDVSIQRGTNCTAAKRDATTPSEFLWDSCAGRCGQYQTERVCSCADSCETDMNCCLDYFTTCINFDVTDSLQTQKLVATSPETTSTTSSPKTRPTTQATTTSTASTTTSTTTTTTTVTIPTTTTTSTSTTERPTVPHINNKKSVVNDTTAVNKITTTQRPTTIKTTKLPETTTSTDKTITKVSIDYSYSSIEYHNINKDMVNKTRREDDADTKENYKEKTTEELKSETSGLKIGLITLFTIVCCVSLVWFVWIRLLRSPRESITLARLRSHIMNDPEVRYISTDIDDN